MILLDLASFKGGKYDIPDAQSKSANKTDVQELIDNYEKQYIYRLIGVVEGNRFMTWLQANKTPTNADYLKILNAFSDDNVDGLGGPIQSLGMVEYLKAAIFYEYIKNGLKTSIPGIVDAAAETGTIQSAASTLRFAENKFNDVLDTINSIQYYCIQIAPSAFPDFNGQRIAVKASLFFI